MEQMSISSAINGLNHLFHTRKSQVWELNSASRFKRRKRDAPQGPDPVITVCWHRSPSEKPGGNGLNNIFDFRGQTIDMSDQTVFALNDSGLHYEEGTKIHISDLLTAAQMQSGCFCHFWWQSTQARLFQTAIKAAWCVGNLFKSHWI